jgi:hypothetical protein
MFRNLNRGIRWIAPVGCAGCLLLILPSSCSDSGVIDSTGTGSGGTNQTGQGGSANPLGTGGAVGSSGSNAQTGTGGAQTGIGGSATGAGGSSAGTGGSTAGTGGGAGGARPDSGAGGADAGRTDAAGTGGARPDSGSAGTGGTTVGTAPPCLNGKKDGTETGVDCGGSCPACPSYMINGPNRNNTVQSACDGGNGYMCTRSMVFSPEFKQAARDDWSMDDPPFVYGTVGHDPDTGGLDANSNTCCQCYQLVFDTPVGATGIPTPKPMIVQTFNTAAGGPKNFDVYMAAGGYGANNACSTVGNAMYNSYPDLGGNFTGGVKASRYSQCVGANNQYTLVSISSMTCQTYVDSQCTLIQSTSSASNQATSQGSCEETNFPESHYHINWNVRAKRVECPTNLTRVTGCKLNSQGLPPADPAAQTVATADSSFRTGYQTTTMQDCCRPTCAYAANVANTDATYSVFYTCDKSGTPQ